MRRHRRHIRLRNRSDWKRRPDDDLAPARRPVLEGSNGAAQPASYVGVGDDDSLRLRVPRRLAVPSHDQRAGEGQRRGRQDQQSNAEQRSVFERMPPHRHEPPGGNEAQRRKRDLAASPLRQNVNGDRRGKREQSDERERRQEDQNFSVRESRNLRSAAAGGVSVNISEY